jgi:hypothetical protein
LVFWATVGLIVLREEVLKLRFEWDRGFLDVAMQPLATSPSPDRWLILVALVGRYLQLMIVPIKLSIDYGLLVLQPTISRSDPYLWLGAAAVAAWIIGTITALALRRWVVLFCLVAMALTHSMVSNVIPIEVIFAERFAYLPSVFFLLLIAMGIAKLPAKAWGGILTVLLMLACVRTFSYARLWNDRAGFYEYSLRQEPNSLKIALLVADVDRQAGRLQEAQELMRRVEERYPGYSELWKMSGLIDESEGNWEMAVEDWKRAQDLGRAVSYANRVEKAMEMRDKARAATRN